MKGIFAKSSIISTHIMGKSDKKKYNSVLNNELEIKEQYTISSVNNRTDVIRKDNISLYFIYFNRIFPTIQHFQSTTIFKKIYLDNGALEPLKRGSNPMIPGILKFQDKYRTSFGKDEIVGVEIEPFGIIAVGLTLYSLDTMKQVQKGEGVNILHLYKDPLHREFI